MDTITLGWNSGVIPQQVVDYSLSLGRVHKVKGNDLFKAKNGFRQHESVWVQDRYFHFAWQPRYPKMDRFNITTHLSQYDSWSEFIDLMYVLFQGEDLLVQATIKRIDLAVDVAIPYAEVFKSLQRGHTKRVTEISSKRKTTYFGKRPDELVLYERPTDPAKVDLWHPSAEWTESEKVECVRVEGRLYKNKTPIKSIREIGALWNYQPFTRLQFREPIIGIIQPYPKHTTTRLESFLYRAGIYGFDAVRKEENAKGDFEKRIGKHLGPLDLDLQQAWMNRLERFGVPKPVTMSDMHQNLISSLTAEV